MSYELRRFVVLATITILVLVIGADIFVEGYDPPKEVYVPIGILCGGIVWWMKQG